MFGVVSGQSKTITRALRCPAMKFATHCVSHFIFLILLSIATFRLEEKYENLEEYNTTERGVRSWLDENFRPSRAIITHVQVGITNSSAANAYVIWQILMDNALDR
ncbi:hypothetical protein ACTXT7_005022 [Hymenolepis weldensis]